MAKRPVPLYDFAAFGQAIKAVRTGRNESRKKVSDEMNISPRYLANIENKGQQPRLQILYELVTRYLGKSPSHEELEAFMPWAPDIQKDCKIPNSDAYVNTYLE